MRLLLIRHGEIDFNRQCRFCGVTDVPLNKYGIAQVRMLKRIIAFERVDRVYASPLQRTQQTAQLLFGRRRIVTAPALQEINFGMLETLFVEEVRRKHPRFYRHWVTNPTNLAPLGGESLADCQKRIWAFIRQLAQKKSNRNKTIALVTHGGPIKILVSTMLGLGFKGFWSFHPEPASVTTVEYAAGKFCLLQRNFYYEKNYPGFGWRP